jgi:hypothetical protein
MSIVPKHPPGGDEFQVIGETSERPSMRVMHHPVIEEGKDDEED